MIEADPRTGVFVGATIGRVSGVDVFSSHLVRGLRALGWPASILLTEPHERLSDHLPFPDDVPLVRLGRSREESWRDRWQSMIAFLEARAPCVYIPNYDWFYSAVTPRLSPGVAVVGIVHSDDPLHYEHAARLGRSWNAIVAVSDVVAEKTAALDASFEPRLHRVPYGIPVPEHPVERSVTAGEPLRCLYAGRLDQAQKGCLDLGPMADELARRGVPFELDVVGAGDEEASLLEALAPHLEASRVRLLGARPNHEVLERIEQADVLVLPSRFEGLPVSLLEALARSCVPVVSDLPGGVRDLVVDGRTGFRVPVGDAVAMADRLERLQGDPGLRAELGRRGWALARNYGIDRMVGAYSSLFEQVWADVRLGRFTRPRGRIRPPKDLAHELAWRGRIPPRIRALGRRVRTSPGRVRARLRRVWLWARGFPRRRWANVRRGAAALRRLRS